jgi:hypothetical protein
VNFSIGIVAHHSRHDRATNLADAVGAEVVMVDPGHIKAGKNHERCYEWLAETGASPWSVVIEDDAIPVTDFRQQLAAVLKVTPSPITSLYLGRFRPPHWQSQIAQKIGGDQHFLMATELLHHVGVAVKTSLIPGMLDFLNNDSDYRTKRRLPIDEAIGRWVRAEGRRVAYTTPSILDHEHRIPTVITKHLSQHKGETGKRPGNQPRKAWVFGARPDWKSYVADIPEPCQPRIKPLKSVTTTSEES